MSVARGAVEAPATIEIWDVNLPSVAVFAACRSQWRALALADGGVAYLGLDYPGLEVVMRRLRLPEEIDEATLFADVQVAESAALDILNGATS